MSRLPQDATRSARRSFLSAKKSASSWRMIFVPLVVQRYPGPNPLRLTPAITVDEVCSHHSIDVAPIYAVLSLNAFGLTEPQGLGYLPTEI
jgi:hypothetical protein